jgi:nucleoside recognition membrane protein YjiH
MRAFERFLVGVLILVVAAMVVIPVTNSVANAMDRAANQIAEAGR